MPITVSELRVHPIKSGRILHLRRMQFDRFGPMHDRRFMVVDPDGKKLTQREIPRLALLKATPLDPTMMQLRFTDEDATDYEDTYIAIEQDTVEVDIWGDQVQAIPLSNPTNDWLSEKLGRPVRIVCMPDDFSRISRGTREPSQTPVGVGFADGYPLLIVSKASLADLNERLVGGGKDSVPMDRFRPNIVLAGCRPYEEDEWTSKILQIGSMRVRMTVPCARCVVITTDQDTGERMKGEPLKTLAKYRRVGKEIRFAMNADHLGTEGSISLGDEVIVLK